MNKKGIALITVILLFASFNVFADDVSIDSSGNISMGVSRTGNLEVTGASAEKAIVGQASGTGGTGVYGINTTSGNYGSLGWDAYGVYGYNPLGWAGYFSGNARVTGNLTVDGSILGPVMGDITGVTAGTGLSGGGPSGDITINADTTYLQRRVNSSCTTGSSIRAINEDGTVICETDDIGVTPSLNCYTVYQEFYNSVSLACNSGYTALFAQCGYSNAVFITRETGQGQGPPPPQRWNAWLTPSDSAATGMTCDVPGSTWATLRCCKLN